MPPSSLGVPPSRALFGEFEADRCIRWSARETSRGLAHGKSKAGDFRRRCVDGTLKRDPRGALKRDPLNSAGRGPRGGVAERICRSFRKPEPEGQEVIRVSQWAEIRQMHLVDEVPKKEIARRLGVNIKTVRRGG